jgi:hypothetical protein
MIVTGLNTNRFLAGNPIPVNLSLASGSFETGSFITMNITRLSTHGGELPVVMPPTILYPSPSGLTIDLSPYIKGLLPYPYVPNSSYQDPVPNYQNFNITFSENQTDTSNAFLNKTFIRGFRREESLTAMTLAINEQLNPSDKIPMWIGYPSARFWIDSSSTIKVTEVVESQYSKQMRTPTNCDPFYLRFLNSLGGYSFWMFNAWDWSTKTTGVGVIERTAATNNRSLGFKEDNTVTVDTRVKREFFPLIRDLIASPVVQVYDKFGVPWKKIELKGQSITESNYEDMIEVSATFDLMLGNKPEVIW